MVTKVLSRPPSEWMDLEPEELGFIKSGIMWDMEMSAKRGSPLLML